MNFAGAIPRGRNTGVVLRRVLSMRWWLALVFAVIVVLTAVAVANVMTLRSEKAFRERAAVLAAGTALTAANELVERSRTVGAREAAQSVSRSRRIALFLFDSSRGLVSASSSNGVAVGSTDMSEALEGALGGRRVVQSVDGGRRIIVGLPVREGPASALVAVVARPDLVAAGDIVRGQLFGTIAISVALGGMVGIVVAFLITSRLRRIARVAAEIEGGNFDLPLRAGFPDELGQLASTIDSMRTRLRGSFARLESERDRLRNLLEQLQEGVIAVDRDLRIVFANSRAKLLIGREALTRGRELPEPWAEVRLRELASSLFDSQAGVLHMRVGFDDQRYSIVGVPSQHQGDTALLVIRDVTLSERRERAEREFVANAAHELRTPLAAIASAVEVLQDGAKTDPRQRDRFLGVIERQSARLGRLVHALLTLARAQTRAEAIRLEVVDLEELLGEAAEELRQAYRVEVDTHCASGLVGLAHHDLLAQAVGNLASNAAKHAGEEPVTLSATPMDGGRVRIEVHDHGSGIDTSHRDRVFDRFYRADDRDAEGFGLGLSIVREVVAAMGGEVEIDSHGNGTVAAIVLPAASRKPVLEAAETTP